MRQKSPYKQQLNKDKEPEFYEIKDFCYYLEGEKRLAYNTIVSYQNDLNKYALYLKKYKNIEDIDLIEEKDINDYILSLKRGGFSSVSISRKISAIKAFHKFCFNELRGIHDNPAKNIKSLKRESHLPNVLSVGEIEMLINVIDDTTILGKRDKAIFELLFSSGMRISELTELTLKQLHFQDKYIIVFGKGSKERLVPLGEVALTYLRNYLNVRNSLLKITTDLVFLNYQGKHLSRNYIFTLLKKYAIEAGINKDISPHTLRHSYATALIENGADLRVVQTLLGHEDISTTAIYTHISDKKLQNDYLKTHPMAKGDKKDEKI